MYQRSDDEPVIEEHPELLLGFDNKPQHDGNDCKNREDGADGDDGPSSTVDDLAIPCVPHICKAMRVFGRLSQKQLRS